MEDSKSQSLEPQLLIGFTEMIDYSGFCYHVFLLWLVFLKGTKYLGGYLSLPYLPLTTFL
jgi:hypothetical protein